MGYSGIYSGHSAPGSRIAGMEIQVFRNENSSQTNAYSHYSSYSYSGLIPNERALKRCTNRATDPDDARNIHEKSFYILKLILNLFNTLRVSAFPVQINGPGKKEGYMRLLNVTLYFHLREGSVFQSTKLPSNADISKVSFSV